MPKGFRERRQETPMGEASWQTCWEKSRQCRGLFFEIRATMSVLSLDNETYIVLSAKPSC